MWPSQSWMDTALHTVYSSPFCLSSHKRGRQGQQLTKKCFVLPFIKAWQGFRQITIHCLCLAVIDHTEVKEDLTRISLQKLPNTFHIVQVTKFSSSLQTTSRGELNWDFSEGLGEFLCNIRAQWFLLIGVRGLWGCVWPCLVATHTWAHTHKHTQVHTYLDYLQNCEVRFMRRNNLSYVHKKPKKNNNNNKGLVSVGCPPHTRTTYGSSRRSGRE